MRKFISMLFFGSVLFFVLVGRVFALNVDEILAHVEKEQDVTKALAADFEEIIAYRGGLQSERMIGRAIIQRPDKIYLVLRKPSNQTVICDGKQAWLYLPSENQAIKQNIGSSEFFKQFEFQLGEEVKELKDRFNITGAGEESLDGTVMHVIKLVPKQKKKGSTKSYYEVKLWLSEKYWLPVKSVAFLLNGTSLTMRLTNIKVNPGIQPGQFSFTPPAGTDVFDGALMGLTDKISEKGK